jgi:3-deoxy-D-manno-octulosonate 8-phosphate phosphatase (KDO 8-P phosphatase)
MTDFTARLRNITTFIFDYDGVLTDGTVLFLESGEHGRMGWVKDGYAIQYALKKGYRIAVMSGAKSNSMAWRCQAIGIENTFLGIKDKQEEFKKYLVEKAISAQEVLFMGDDIPDIQVMQEAGIAACPSDAAEEVKAVSVYISRFSGGRGCVRDVIEQVLKAKGNWMDADAFTW